MSPRPFLSLLGATLLLLSAGLAGLGCAAAGVGNSEDAAPIHVVVLHTSDVHGQVKPRGARWIDSENPPLIGGIGRVAAYVREVRAEHDGPGEAVLAVDAGDWYQGTPEGLIGNGSGFLEAFAMVGYDAMCVGNHDLDHGIAELERLLAEVELPTVLTNVWRGEERVTWGEAWRVFDLAGVRVGVVGLLTPATPEITHEDARQLRFEDPAAALTRVRAELEDEVDWILPLTHLGLEGDIPLARAHPDLPLFLGGHSHTYLEAGRHEGEVLIAHVGAKAGSVGRSDLWFDPVTHELLEMSYRVVDLLEEPAAEFRHAALDAVCANLAAEADREMSKAVGRLSAPLLRSDDRYASGPAGNLMCDVMRERAGAEVALQNRGGVRCDLPEGEITRRHLFELFPFGNHLVTLTLSGEQLERCLRSAIEGTAHSGLEFSGMTAEVHVDASGAGTLVRLVVNGEPLEPQRDYRVVTNSFLAGGGDAYAELGHGRDRREDPASLRAILEEHFTRAGVVVPPEEDRYVVTR